MEAGEEVLVVNLKGRSVDKREFHMGLLDGEYVVEKGNDRLCLICLTDYKVCFGSHEKVQREKISRLAYSSGQ